MAFKKVAATRKYYKYSECEKGQMLIDNGLYVGEEQGKYGIQHIFKQQDGQVVVLNSAGQLNWQLENHATPGKTRCNVFYAGKITLEKGAMAGKESHQFELETDDDAPQAEVKAASVEDALTPDISL